jgi:lipopolysaccharide/colanic/teichoic acid biosynthesis glycosyltransferase
MYRVFFKRLIDFLLSLIMLIILSPIILIIYIFLFFANNGQVFFVQDRPGQDEKTIRIFKFKTMNENKDENGQLLPDANRLTSVGRFVRSTSMDELPQLFNVLKGDMSLIGPRPLLIKYLPLYNEFQKRRHEVKPGITGWAQINGRNSISWQKKFELDVWYVDNHSFLLDLKIIGLTIKKVFIREGISGEGTATVKAFKGNFK